MLHDWGVIAVAFGYIGLLFVVASYGERQREELAREAAAARATAAPALCADGTENELMANVDLPEDIADVALVQPRGERLAVVTQTTLSVDDAADILAEVKRRFPQVRQPKQQDICYATQNRQDAVKVLAPAVDVVLVVGQSPLILREIVVADLHHDGMKLGQALND